MRFPGQYSQAETGLNQTWNRDYDPVGGGRYIESDPIGQRSGVNTYAYGLDNPLWYFDLNGREITCGGNFCGTNTPAYVPPAIQPPTISFGAEGHYIIGGGLTSVTCTAECGAQRTFRYMKLCFGGAIGAGLGGGLVGNRNGTQCRSETYTGYFYEAGASSGVLSGAFDIGYTDTGGMFPLPNGASGVTETGGGVSLPRGALIKSTWCYYFPLGE
jgi:RHS repeat-associated protein